MLRTFSLIALIIFLGLPAFGAPPGKTSDAPFEFIGFSTTTTASGIGLPGMNAICQSDFGRTDVRMATTKEYSESTNTEPPDPLAWINSFIRGGGDSFRSADFSGLVEDGRNLTCGPFWGNAAADGTGMSVDTNGGITLESCNQVLSIACSARGQ